MSDLTYNFYCLCADLCASAAFSCWVAVYLIGFASWLACSHFILFLPCLNYTLLIPSPSAPASPSNDPNSHLNDNTHFVSTGPTPASDPLATHSGSPLPAPLRLILLRSQRLSAWVWRATILVSLRPLHFPWVETRILCSLTLCMVWTFHTLPFLPPLILLTI